MGFLQVFMFWLLTLPVDFGSPKGKPTFNTQTGS